MKPRIEEMAAGMEIKYRLRETTQMNRCQLNNELDTRWKIFKRDLSSCARSFKDSL